MIKLWIINLSYHTQRTSLTVFYVAIYQSVTRNSTTACGYVYNRDFKPQYIPISHFPGKFKFLSNSWIFVSKTGGVIIFLASMNSVTFILDTCKASFVRYLQVLLNFEKRVPAVKLA